MGLFLLLKIALQKGGGMLFRFRDDRGAYLIWALYLVPILFGLVALFVEMNMIRTIREELQAFVDAAAFAGVSRAYGEAVYVDVPEGDIDRVQKKLVNVVLKQDPNDSYIAAQETFRKNVVENGWGFNDSSRPVYVMMTETYGFPKSSGAPDSVLLIGEDGNPVPRNPGEDDDVYYYETKVHVRPVLTGTVLRLFGGSENGEIVMTARSEARTRIRVDLRNFHGG